jgi:titin
MIPTWLRRIRWQPSSSQRQRRAAIRWASTPLELEPLEDRLLLSTYFVTNTNDSGAGSLRQAILDANANPGPDAIAFKIGQGGVQAILPTSALPAITDSVVIDGTTQPGFVSHPLIVLNGSRTGANSDGLTISAGGCTVRGLDINHFAGNGLLLLVGSGNVISGNYIGTNADGTVAAPNGFDGIFVDDSPDSTIGGSTPGAGNLISGNGGDGVLLGSDSDRVQGNRIGTDASGTRALGNGGDGVMVSVGGFNTVGGRGIGAGNLISGNGMTGVFIGGYSNVVRGNLIGTDVTGAAALGNRSTGVFLFGAGNTVGGSVDGAGNVISGNLGDGVLLNNGAEQVLGNRIGTDVTGTRALGNDGNGVLILGAFDSVGGTTTGARNLISGNKLTGVTITTNGSTFNNQVQGNFIGTDASGMQSLGNGDNGVSIFGGTSNNTIGGTVAGTGNLISGNVGDGVYISASNNQVQGNLIGTDVSGTHALGNANGLTLSAFAFTNTIGGTTAGAGNLISGNTSNGVLISGTSNLVQGNRIGTDLSGSSAVGNGSNGLAILNGPYNTLDNTIGGTAAGAGNVISGNTGDGVMIGGANNLVQGNRIGTDISGTTALGNGSNGIALANVSILSSGNTVGGTVAGAGNVISGNKGDGLFISSSSERDMIESRG